MLPPISDVTHITLAHCDAVGRGYPPHQFSVTINSAQDQPSQKHWNRRDDRPAGPRDSVRSRPDITPRPSRSVDGNASKTADPSARNTADAGQSDRHNESNLKESTKDIPKPSVDRNTIKEDLKLKTCGRCEPERHLEFNLGRIKALWSSASNLREMYPVGPRNERQLYNHLHEYSSYFRIGQETFARSLAILGWERLLVTMDYLAEKIHGIQYPRAYLQSMLTAFETGQSIAGGRVSPADLSARLTAV